ncbi:MAG TPA: GC-type dockerin domain-anchored protein [Phycisphaerales bacterium]|nr:GC-type dockerin domain-anchored protein [Phycisphaerales bacterium]
MTAPVNAPSYHPSTRHAKAIMHNRLSTIALLALATSAAPALAQLRVCTWNVTNYGSSDTSRNAYFQTAIYGVVPAGLALQGRSMSPDVIIGQEFLTTTGVINFRNMLNAAPGSPGDWASAPFLDGADTDSAFFYRTGKVQFLGVTTVAVGSSDTSNQPRDTRRYDFRPVGYTSAGASIGAYSVHLKAQGGTNDTGRRLIECQRIRDNAQGVNTNGAGTGLPAGYSFLLGGDTNITSSGAAEYVELVSSQADNTGRFFDPIKSPGDWRSNPSAFRYILTQEPAGNMDDRFDFILISDSLRNGAGMEYIGNTNLTYSTFTWNDPNHSYRCWGSDGGAVNAGLRTTGNTFVGPVIAQALIDSSEGNGHLPIIADFKVPAEFQSSASSIAFGGVTQGEPASTAFTITNAGDTAKWTAAGIADLRYTMTVSGPFTVTGAGVQQTDAASPGGNTHTVTMNTSVIGPAVGQVTFITDAPDAPSFSIALSGTVTAPPCPADLGSQGGNPGGDGLLDNNDFVVFIDYFFGQDARADVGVQGGLPGADGAFDNNDFVVFIDRFFASCGA